MPTKTIADLHAELDLFRRVHHGAALKASGAYALVKRLQAATVWLPREETLSHLAYSLYFNAGTDASETYDSVEDFQAELTLEVEAAWPPAAVRDGHAGFELKPFFNPSLPFFSDLRVGNLHGCDLGELCALDVVRPLSGVPVLNPRALSGLAEEELVVLVKFHHDKTLGIVNALRHLATALNYLRTDLARGITLGSSGPARPLTDEVHELVNALSLAVALPFLPAPANHFGTEASRTNPLQTLAHPPEGLACFLGEQEQVVAPPVRALITNYPGGFCLVPSVLDALFERSPEYFCESVPLAFWREFSSPSEKHFPNSVIHGDQISFLNAHEPTLRSDAWLLEQYDRLGSAALVGEYCKALKVVEFPADADWQLYVAEDGTEGIQEKSRHWD